MAKTLAEKVDSGALFLFLCRCVVLDIVIVLCFCGTSQTTAPSF
jgi:hypothetical protein